MNEAIAERFMRYARIDTEADPNSASFPSSEKQKDLGRLLQKELLALGASEVEMDEWGYVFATIPATSKHEGIPTLCFCSHMDTAPDCSGKDVKPLLHRAWNGQDLILPDDSSQTLTLENEPYLRGKVGQDPEVTHGKIRILFTPDEEVGRGVEHLDMNKLNADYGYTLDGGPLGYIEDETFSADAMTFHFQGLSAHPGYAKGIMQHAAKIAGEFLVKTNISGWSPESTEDRQGFVHPTSISGGLESSSVSFILRDHQTAKLDDYAHQLVTLANETIKNYPGATMTYERSEQYRNMKEILQGCPFVTDYAVEAMESVGIEPVRHIIRGGTDGSKLSFMGLPCPNIFTGEMAIHSRREYVVVQDMEAALKTLIALVQRWESHQ
jgi:tripeptide aminopeptidase